MPLYAIYDRKTLDPNHVVVTEDGEPYSVPNSRGGWRVRRPYSGGTIGLTRLPPDEQRLMLMHHGVIDRHGLPTRTCGSRGVDERGYRTDLYPDEPAGPLGGDDTL